MDDIKIGDNVRIKNDGWLYSSYEEMAKILNATNWERNRFPINDIDVIYVVKNYEEHPTENDDVILIEDKNNGNQFLIGCRGLEILPHDFIDEEEFLV